jgi:hypothetical protein
MLFQVAPAEHLVPLLQRLAIQPAPGRIQAWLQQIEIIAPIAMTLRQQPLLQHVEIVQIAKTVAERFQLSQMPVLPLAQ